VSGAAARHVQGILDTSTVIMLSRIRNPDSLPQQPLITAVTLAELSVGPLVATDDAERAARQAHIYSQPLLAMMPGVPEKRTHYYVRNGITSLFAALDMASGKVIGTCTVGTAPPSRPGWRAIIERLRSDPRGPLAQALSARLMLFLMIRVFARSESPPDGVLNSPHLATAVGIQDYLVGQFLNVAVTDAPGHRFDSARQNDAWLRYVASHFAAGANGRLSWWRFFEVLRGSAVFVLVRVAIGAIITAGLCGILFGVFGHLQMGLVFGAVLGGGGAAVMRVPPDPQPKGLPYLYAMTKGRGPPSAPGSSPALAVQ
jgi:hypothetical protein